MKLTTVKKFHTQLSYFKINKNGCVIVDIENRIYKFDTYFNLKTAFKIRLPNNKPNENGIVVDDCLKYLILSISNYPLSVWNIDDKKIMGKFTWHKGDVLSVAFGKSYFASGGIDGKIFLYSLDLFKMVSKVAQYKDFISTLELDDYNAYAGSFDKSVLFVSLSSFKKKIRKLHLEKVKKLYLKKYLFSASLYCDVIKWDVNKEDFIDKINFYKNFKDFALGEKYLFILTDTKVILYDFEKEVIVNDNFFNIQADKIAFFDDKLFFIQNNLLLKLELIDENELLDLILSEKYKEAYEKVLLNPFLEKSRSFQKLEKIYEITIKKAFKYYEAGNKIKVVELLKSFMNIPQKKAEIIKIMSHYENILKFINAYKKRDFALFYQLAEQFELLKKTKYYKVVEKEWEIRFEKAKKLALEGKYSEVREILKDFIPVAGKIKLIELILKNAKLFDVLNEKISKKDFKGFFALVKQHPELKNTKEYRKVMEYAEELYEKANKELLNENFKLALKYATILEDIEGYELKAKEIIEKSQTALKFLEIFNRDKNQAFEMLDKYPFLKNLKAVKLYEEKWQSRLIKAEKEAFKGHIKKSLEILKDYEFVSAKRNRIKNMIKSAYLDYIKKTKNKQAVSKYIQTFGKDEELLKAINL